MYSMSGNTWESLPYPTIIDSGASCSVLPVDWCGHTAILFTEASRRGQHYTAANGGKIYNKGKKLVTMMSKEGPMRNMKFTPCKVEKALGSVFQICSSGHTVVFNAPDHFDGSYIMDIESGECMQLAHKNGVCVLDTKVVPFHKQTRPFGGQGR